MGIRTHLDIVLIHTKLSLGECVWIGGHVHFDNSSYPHSLISKSILRIKYRVNTHHMLIFHTATAKSLFFGVIGHGKLQELGV
jgi:hypothetical protein